MNKKIKALREDIYNAIFTASNSKQPAILNKCYSQYFTRDYEFMKPNRSLMSCLKYNNHIDFKKKDKCFMISDYLNYLLLEVANKHNLESTTIVGLLDSLSNSILKQSMIDDSISSREIKQKFFN